MLSCGRYRIAMCTQPVTRTPNTIIHTKVCPTRARERGGGEAGREQRRKYCEKWKAIILYYVIWLSSFWLPRRLLLLLLLLMLCGELYIFFVLFRFVLLLTFLHFRSIWLERWSERVQCPYCVCARMCYVKRCLLACAARPHLTLLPLHRPTYILAESAIQQACNCLCMKIYGKHWTTTDDDDHDIPRYILFYFYDHRNEWTNGTKFHVVAPYLDEK